MLWGVGGKGVKIIHLKKEEDKNYNSLTQNIFSHGRSRICIE